MVTSVPMFPYKMMKRGGLFILLPEPGHEKEQYGEDFQTSHQHVGTHEPLSYVVDVGEVGCGTGGAHSGTDVAEHGDAASEAGFGVVAQKSEDKGADDHQYQIDKDEGEGAADIVVGDDLAGDADAQDGAWMEHFCKLVEGALGTDEQADHLDSAAGAARTGSNGHEYKGGHPEGHAPFDVIEALAGESCAGDDAGNVEKGCAEVQADGVQEAVCLDFCVWPLEEHQEENQCYSAYGIEESVHFLVAEEDLWATYAQIVKEGIVEAGEQHEGDADVFNVCRMEEADALGVGAETSGGNGGHGVAYGIVQVHGTRPEQQGAKGGEEEIDGEGAASGGANLGFQFVQFQSGHFRGIDIAVLHFVDGNQSHGEHNDSQTANPVHHAAPETQSVRESVNVGEDGGACGGESAHGLKEGVGQRHAQMQDEGHHANDGEKHPRERYHKKAVCPGKVLFRALFPY